MQSPTTAEAPPPVKRKYTKKKDKEDKNNKKKKQWETDSAFIPDPATERPEPDIIEKSYVMTKEGQWVEEKEKDEAIEALLNEVNQLPHPLQTHREPLRWIY